MKNRSYSEQPIRSVLQKMLWRYLIYLIWKRISCRCLRMEMANVCCRCEEKNVYSKFRKGEESSSGCCCEDFDDIVEQRVLGASKHIQMIGKNDWANCCWQCWNESYDSGNAGANPGGLSVFYSYQRRGIAGDNECCLSDDCRIQTAWGTWYSYLCTAYYRCEKSNMSGLYGRIRNRCFYAVEIGNR